VKYRDAAGRNISRGASIPPSRALPRGQTSAAPQLLSRRAGSALVPRMRRMPSSGRQCLGRDPADMRADRRLCARLAGPPMRWCRCQGV